MNRPAPPRQPLRFDPNRSLLAQTSRHDLVDLMLRCLEDRATYRPSLVA